MRLSDESIKGLQKLLKEVCDLDYTEVQAQEAGMDILRFVVAKAQRKNELAEPKEIEYEQQFGNGGAIAR